MNQGDLILPRRPSTWWAACAATVIIVRLCGPEEVSMLRTPVGA